MRQQQRVVLLLLAARRRAGLRPLHVPLPDLAQCRMDMMDTLRGADAYLVLAMIRWLVREEGLAAVNPRVPVPPMVLLTESQLKAVYLLTAVGLPLLAVFGGVVVWWRRR